MNHAQARGPSLSHHPIISLDYGQALITGGSFTQVIQQGAKGGFERLQEAAAPGAFHNSGERFDPPKCHPNTRVAVIERIMNWILGCDPELRNALIMWLYGPAGSGKSAIAQTIAEMCDTQRRLLASFFFSRFDSSRNNASSLMASLAYQIALNIPDVRPRIVDAVDHDPLIFKRSLEAQMSCLIAEPLRELTESGFFNQPSPPRLIIIDGLDECVDRNIQSNILDTISRSLGQHRLPLIFFIASRPEQHITYKFNHPSFTSISTRLALDDSYQPDADIRLFLNDKFNEIRETHPHRTKIPSRWAREDVLEKIVEKASGQFIYASTVIKYVSSIRHRPTDRLDVILGLRPARRDSPFAELDALYTHIFSSVEDLATTIDIIGLHILGGATRTSGIEDILSLPPGDVETFLADLNAILITFEPYLWCDDDRSIRFLHASLPDFLLDESRSKTLFINPPLKRAQYAHLCFQLIQADCRLTKNSKAKYDCLIRHLPEALQTSEIRQDIIDFSVLPFFEEDDSRPFLLESLFEISRSMKCYLMDDREQLYARHLRQSDDLLLLVLDSYHSNQQLQYSLLVACAEKLASGNSVQRRLCHLDAEAKMIDSKALNLFYHPSFHYSVQHQCRFHTLEFLTDPSRSGHLNYGRKYEMAALSSMMVVSNHQSHQLSLPYSDHAKRMRLYKPWTWRKTWGKYALDLRRISTPQKSSFALVPPWIAGDIERPRYPACLSKEYSRLVENTPPEGPGNIFLHALLDIPLFLNSSGKCEELSVFAIRTFAPQALLFPRESRVARNAIEEYICRVEREGLYI